MQKKPTIVSRPPVEIDTQQMRTILVSVATIINNTLHHYWLSEGDARLASNEAYKLLAAILHSCDTIAFRIIDGALIVNGSPVEDVTKEMKSFVEHLSKLGIDNFTVSKGLTEDEFSNLVEVMSARPDEFMRLGGFADLLAQCKISHVETKKMIYQEISEGQVVVYEDDISGSGRTDADDTERVGNILAFLKGNASATDASVSDDVRAIASDAERMADLILQAADVRKNSLDVDGGESLGDFVVGCLRRTYTEMTRDKAYNTKAGKRRVKKNLLLLEDEILNRMREMSDDFHEADLQTMADAAADITDEIQIDALADEYVAKRAASEAVEGQILDLLGKRGIDHAVKSGVADRLMSRGLSLDGWQELVVKTSSRHGGAIGSGTGLGGGGGLGDVTDVVHRLDVLLDHMEKQFVQADQPAREENARLLVNTLTTMSANVRALTEATQTRIQTLVDSLAADEASIETVERSAQNAGRDIRMTRKEVLECLAGIVKEMAGPLSMVRSSLNMIESMTMGTLTESQSRILNVAVENAVAIGTLLDKLTGVSRRTPASS